MWQAWYPWHVPRLFFRTPGMQKKSMDSEDKTKHFGADNMGVLLDMNGAISTPDAIDNYRVQDLVAPNTSRDSHSPLPPLPSHR